MDQAVNLPTPHDRLMEIINSAKLHPLAHDVWVALADALEEELPVALEPRDGTCEGARALLAGLAQGAIEGAWARGSRYTVNLATLALVTLALDHELSDSGAACDEAQAKVIWALGSPALAVLRPLIQQALSDVRDRVALDQGRRILVHSIRRELARLERLHPRVLDVVPSDQQVTIGGQPLAYRRADGRGRSRRRPLRSSNLPGQLVLLLAAGHRPVESRVTHPTVLSWARQSLVRATGGAVEIRDSAIIPELRLTRRARAEADAIASAAKG